MFRTTLCYIEQNDCYLMLHRNKKKNDINEGKWLGVGGKLETGETPDDCMKREILEETGLTVKDYAFRGLIHFISEGNESEEMYLYTVSSFEGVLTTDCNEGELQFIPKSEILNLNLWEGDPFFLRKLLDDAPLFHMTLSYDKSGKLLSMQDYPDIAASLPTEGEGCITCKHGFSTRLGGVSRGIYYSLNLGMNRGDDISDVKENWRIFLSSCGIEEDEFVCGEQVHGNHVVIATREDARPAFGPGFMHKADGYVTNIPRLPLVIFTADCVPVLLEDPEAGIVGAVHCGWRSTVADIEKETIDAFIRLGSNPENIRIELGPSIDACCFEVGSEVIEACQKLLHFSESTFSDKAFPNESSHNESLSGDSSSDDSSPTCFEQFYHVSPSHSDKYMLDLRGVIRQRFIMLGVQPTNIINVGSCTMCHPELFYSHRYTGGQRGSLACVIMRE